MEIILKGRKVLDNSMSSISYLTPLDTIWGNPHAFQLYLFKKSPDSIALQAGLQTIIDKYPDIAGRLFRDDNGKAYISRNNAGVKFSFIDIDGPMPNYGLLHIVDDDSDRYIAPAPTEIVNVDEPLFRVQLTKFGCGAGILGVMWPHSLCDGTGYTALMARWARVCRGSDDLPDLSLDRTKLFSLSAKQQTTPPLESEFVLLKRPQAEQFLNKILQQMSEREYRVLELNTEVVERLGNETKQLVSGTDQWISKYDVIVAKIWQTIALCQATKDPLYLGSLYNLRGHSSALVEESYFGNAITFGTTAYDADQLRQVTLVKLAQEIRRTAIRSLAIDKIANEFEVLHSISNSPDEESCIPRGFFEVTKNGTIGNNVSHFPIHEFDFGTGKPYWVSGPKRIYQRYFTLYPNLNDDHINLILHIYLPSNEMCQFDKISKADKFFSK